jgi:hypothetical protein
VAFLGNVAYADKLCCSVEPQALYSDHVAPQDVITVIALVALCCKLISPCGIRKTTAKGLSGFEAYRHKRYHSDRVLWCYTITVIIKVTWGIKIGSVALHYGIHVLVTVGRMISVCGFARSLIV